MSSFIDHVFGHEINSRQRNKILKKGKWFYDLTFNVILRDTVMDPWLCCPCIFYPSLEGQTNLDMENFRIRKTMCTSTKLMHWGKDRCFLEISKLMAIGRLKQNDIHIYICTQICIDIHIYAPVHAFINIHTYIHIAV